MTNGFSEQDLASMEGPRAMKEPGTPEWCWQTISAMQHMWNSLHLNYEHYMTILGEAKQERIWEKVPPDKPYGSEDTMLKQVEVGNAKDAQKRMKVQTLAAQARALQKHGANQHLGIYHDKVQSTRGDTDPEYLLSVIARDNPEIMQRVINGEFQSARAAAREAGIALAQPKKTVTLSDNVDRLVATLKSHYSAEQIQRLRKGLEE